MSRDREEIVGAMHALTSAPATANPGLALCWAFSRARKDFWDAYDEVPKYLTSLGGLEIAGYFWPISQEGRNQRLTFLAFMLAWLDDIEAGTVGGRHP